MAFCQNCGAPVEANFCARCGAPAAPATTSEPAAGSTAAPGATSGPSPAGISENVAAALCYGLGLITGILFLVLAPYNQNKTIRFHAFQSIFLHVALLVIFWGVFPAIAMVSGGIIWFMSPLVWLGALVLWLFMIYKAYQNQKVVLPIIGDFAQKQA